MNCGERHIKYRRLLDARIEGIWSLDAVFELLSDYDELQKELTSTKARMVRVEKAIGSADMVINEDDPGDVYLEEA